MTVGGATCYQQPYDGGTDDDVDEAYRRAGDRPEGNGPVMAGPVSEEERRRGRRQVAAGFVAVVGVSAGTTAYFSGATLVEAGAISLAGLLVGVLLLVFLGVR